MLNKPEDYREAIPFKRKRNRMDNVINLHLRVSYC